MITINFTKKQYDMLTSALFAQWTLSLEACEKAKTLYNYVRESGERAQDGNQKQPKEEERK